MSDMISRLTKAFEPGEPSVFRNMAVAPLLGKAKQSDGYITLAEALAAKLVVVSELSQGGSVPELRVRNDSDRAVLALDGEELEGAKQNRVLNTSILLKKKSEIVIPVSCTERGRWSHAAAECRDSGNILFRTARASKNIAVSDSLVYSERFDSNQGEIWNSIDSLHKEAGIHSPTGAMKDFFSARGASFEDYLKAFPCREGQCGLLVFLDGRVAGFDYVSQASAYLKLHGKLLKSYAVESLLARNTGGSPVSVEKAGEFLENLKDTTATRFKSPGHGWDHRYSGKSMVGSVLAWRGRAVHAAFFAAGNGRADSGMSDLRRRMGYRG